MSVVEETRAQHDLVLRAIGMTARSERLKLLSQPKLAASALSQPLLAVLSSPESRPAERNHYILGPTRKTIVGTYHPIH